MVDLERAAAPRSDQLNYDDLVSGPVTVTIQEVRDAGDGRAAIHTAEHPGRPWYPSRGMLRLLMAAWGKDSATYPGRRAHLYGDSSVKYGGQAVGGIRIAALSGLTEPLTVPLTLTRGKRAPFTVQPLPDAPPVPAFASADHARAYWTERKQAGASPTELAAIAAAVTPAAQESN